MTLSYRFDSSGVVVTILRGVLALLAVVVVPGILYTLIVSHSTVALVQLLLIAALVVWFGGLVLRNLIGSRGWVTGDGVIVERVSLYGVRLAGPEGRFTAAQFEAVRVDRSSGPIGVQGRAHARVYFAGRDGVPDILIARTRPDAGRALGGELAAALGLPVLERRVPY